MKICIDGRMLGAKNTTGIGVYIEKLLENLTELDLQNEYSILLGSHNFDDVTNPKIKKILVKSKWYSYSEQIELPKVLYKNKFDLVHFPQFNTPLLYRKKFITTIHDLTPLYFPGPKVQKSFIRKLAFNKVLNNSLKNSKKIITVSNFTKDKIVKKFKVHSDKIEVTYLGFENNFTKTIEPEVLKKYKISKDYIFYLGVFRDHKNLPTLVEAFNQIKKTKDIQLVLGGSLDERYPEVKQSIESSPHKQDIIVTDFIPEKDLSALYSQANVFVLPSFMEGFGLVALEALACETPVVASNSSCLPEVLEDGALYFDPEKSSELSSQIAKVMDNDELRQDLIKRGLEITQKYNWQECAKQTLKVYESV